MNASLRRCFFIGGSLWNMKKLVKCVGSFSSQQTLIGYAALLPVVFHLVEVRRRNIINASIAVISFGDPMPLG